MYKLNHAKCVPYKQVILFPENMQIYHGSSISLCHSVLLYSKRLVCLLTVLASTVGVSDCNAMLIYQFCG